jgi:protein-S-isoprenylcysteine O-methyltransferase Ste14
MQKSWFAATATEFRLRVFFITAIFFAGFWAYGVDRVNTDHALSVWLANHAGHFGVEFYERLVAVVASLFVFAGAAMRTWGTSYLKASVMGDWKLHTERLVADGPYRHVRNPLYFGNILMAIGTAAMMSRVGAVIMIGGMFLFVLRLMLREEAELRAAQGESYERYAAAVPRMFPSFTARVPPAGGKPNWLDGTLGETMIWVWGISILVFAATLSVPAFEIVFWASFPVHFLFWGIRKRMERNAAAAATPAQPN